jgi:hypothetical protein
MSSSVVGVIRDIQMLWKISRLFYILLQLHMEQEATGEIESLTGEKGERSNDGLADLGSIGFVDAAIWSWNCCSFHARL